MKLDLEGIKGEEVIKYTRFNGNLGRYVLYSTLIHFFVGVLLEFAPVGLFTSQYRKVQQQTPIQVSLYQDTAPPISEIPIGQETQVKLEQAVDNVSSARKVPEIEKNSLGERVKNLYTDLVGPIKGGFNSITDGVNKINPFAMLADYVARETGEAMIEGVKEGLEEVLKDIEKEYKKNNKIGVGFSDEELDNIAEEIRRFARAVDKVERSYKLSLLRENEPCIAEVLSNNGRTKSISDCYTERSKPHERNEISYSDFFMVYGNAYFFLNNKYRSLLPILQRNLPLTKIIEFDVKFNGDGIFRIVRLEYMPGFNDENGKVLEHYRELLLRMPNKFVPPPRRTSCTLSYVILNPARQHQGANQNYSSVSK